MAHLGADEPGIAEELVCLAHVTGGQRRPDRARANRSSLIVEPRHDIDRKAELCALRREIFGRPPAVEAEMKIEADDDAGDGEPSDQNARDELGGGQTRQRRIERQHDRAVEPDSGQQPQLRALVGQTKQRLVRPEEAAGMRLEGERRRRPAERLRARQRRGDDRAMAAVNPVEVADGKHRAVERVVGRRFATDHDERLDRLRLVGHGGANGTRSRIRDDDQA
jgi:hypothetical protein